MLAVGLVSAAAGATAIGVGAATAAVPTFPDNILVFPNRDFVSVEGYQDHVGETATLEVLRSGQVVGSAQSVVRAGTVAFEVNHPGGVCWGAGTNLRVTPDIRPGDRVAIRFGGTTVGDTTVQDAAVDAAPQLSGTTLTVTGHIAADVDPTQLEQRIVNPDLTALVGRRDIRAVPGPVVPATRGGYSSGLTVDGTRVTATYEFDSADAATVAANGGGERMMSWQVLDADGNRQGLTIAEFGELGGPGIGGCPAGPADQAAPQPGTAAAVRSADRTQLQVSWTPATPAPGAADVTGYSVVAIEQTTSASGEQVQVGKRTPASATRTTIGGLTPGESYIVEVRSLSDPRMSEAFSVQAPPPTPPGGDTTPPVVTASPAPTPDGVTEADAVTLSTEQSADIYYTTDGSPALDNGDLPSDAARLYTGPIPIRQETTIHFVAFDRAGNFAQGVGTYAPPAPPALPPAAPTLGASTAGQGSVTLRWSASDPTITGFGVQLYDQVLGTPVGALRETSDASLTITDLTPGVPYSFTVKARNAAGYGPESARSGPLTPTAPTDRITIGTARWRSGDFRVSGSGSVVGAVVTVRARSPTGTVLGRAAVTAAAPPATGGVYDLRLRNNLAPPQSPGTIYVVSSQGGVAGPFTVG